MTVYRSTLVPYVSLHWLKPNDAFQLGDMFLICPLLPTTVLSVLEQYISDTTWASKSATYLLFFSHRGVPSLATCYSNLAVPQARLQLADAVLSNGWLQRPVSSTV